VHRRGGGEGGGGKAYSRTVIRLRCLRSEKKEGLGDSGEGGGTRNGEKKHTPLCRRKRSLYFYHIEEKPTKGKRGGATQLNAKRKAVYALRKAAVIN